MLNCSTVSQLLFSTMPYKKVPKYSISTSIRNYSTTTDFQLFHLNNGILNCSVFNIFYQLFCLNVVQYSILTTLSSLFCSSTTCSARPTYLCLQFSLPTYHPQLFVFNYSLRTIFSHIWCTVSTIQYIRLYYCAPFKLFKSCTGAHGAFTVHMYFYT